MNVVKGDKWSRYGKIYKVIKTGYGLNGNKEFVCLKGEYDFIIISVADMILEKFVLVKRGWFR